MNILLLVTSFLIIFSAMLYSFAKQTSDVKDKTFYFTTFMDLEREALSGIQKNQYRRVVLPKSKKKGGSKDSSSKPLCVSRDRMHPSDTSKLNLSPLLEKSQSPFHKRLHEIAADFLRRIYANTPVEELAKKLGVVDFEYAILEALMAKSHDDPTLTSFEQLCPKDDRLNQIYAKMCAGTKKYNIKNKLGYPPLEDFFYLAQPKQSPIHFGFASTPLLEAVFGEEIAKHIVQQEEARATKDGPISLEHRELEALLNKESGKKVVLTDLEGLLEFDHKRLPVRVYTLYDKTGQISRKVREEKRKRGPAT